MEIFGVRPSLADMKRRLEREGKDLDFLMAAVQRRQSIRTGNHYWERVWAYPGLCGRVFVVYYERRDGRIGMSSGVFSFADRDSGEMDTYRSLSFTKEQL